MQSSGSHKRSTSISITEEPVPGSPKVLTDGTGESPSDFNHGLPASISRSRNQPIIRSPLQNPSMKYLDKACPCAVPDVLLSQSPQQKLYDLRRHLRKKRSISQLLTPGEVTEQHKTINKIRTIATGENGEDVVTLTKDKANKLQVQVGNYKVGNLLGWGGGAKVFLGRHARTGAKVAIKILHKLAGDDKEGDVTARQRALQIEQLRREYTVHYELCHKNIIRLLGVVENDSMICITMEYAENGDLFDYIYKRGKLSHQEAWRIFRQIVAALLYLHARGYCHRDLKPENIFLNEHNDILLGDFGHAEVWPFKLESQPLGSLEYAAPEVLETSGRAYVGPEIDVWSLGVVLLMMVLGKNPFAAKTAVDVLHAQSRLSEFLSHPALRGDAQLVDLLTRLLAIEPWRRARLCDVLSHPWFEFGPRASMERRVSTTQASPLRA